MRNCFVPGCDAHCKKSNIVQRKMFLAPIKQLDLWAELLPNKRNFKKHDRVCERHFKEEDIIQFWEVNINGLVHLTPRDKPKLRENAVPCKNLPNKDEVLEESPKRQIEKIQILSNKIVAPAKRRIQAVEEKGKPPIKRLTKKPKMILIEKKTKSEEAVIESPAEVNGEEEPKSIEIEPEPIAAVEISVEEYEMTENLQEKLDAFECIYDEAFDVTLPSLLWGIHRDPEKKFIAFSEFNQSTMTTSKLLHITDTCHCKIFINNKLKSSKNLNHEELSTESLSLLLEELVVKESEASS